MGDTPWFGVFGTGLLPAAIDFLRRQIGETGFVVLVCILLALFAIFLFWTFFSERKGMIAELKREWREASWRWWR